MKQIINIIYISKIKASNTTQIKSKLIRNSYRFIIIVGQMSNVHRLGDYNRVNDNNGNNNRLVQGMSEPVTRQQLWIASEHRVLFVSGKKQVKDPKDESYWDMLTYALCPVFNFLSFTFLICIVDIGMFIFEVSIGFSQDPSYFKDSNYLLGIKSATLIDYGGNYQPNVLNGQVYRLISAMFLHVYFMHLFGNLITTFMFLSRIQYTFGFKQTSFIYILSGISVCSSQVVVKAGASTALYGIIGVIFGYIIINWNGLDLIGKSMKCQIGCTAAMIILFILIFTPSAGQSSSNTVNIDYFGHLGGFLAGVWLSCIHKPIINEKRQKIIRITFAGLFIIQTIVCFLVFFLTKTAQG